MDRGQLITTAGLVKRTTSFKRVNVKGGRVMIALFVNYSTVAVANSLGKKFIFPRYRWTCGAVWRQPVKKWMLAKGE